MSNKFHFPQTMSLVRSKASSDGSVKTQEAPGAFFFPRIFSRFQLKSSNSSQEDRCEQESRVELQPEASRLMEPYSLACLE